MDRTDASSPVEDLERAGLRAGPRTQGALGRVLR